MKCGKGTMALVGLGGATAGALIYKAYKKSQEAAVRGLGVVLRAPISTRASVQLKPEVSITPLLDLELSDLFYDTLSKAYNSLRAYTTTIFSDNLISLLSLSKVSDETIKMVVRKGLLASFRENYSLSQVTVKVVGTYLTARRHSVFFIVYVSSPRGSGYSWGSFRTRMPSGVATYDQVKYWIRRTYFIDIADLPSAKASPTQWY